MNGISIQDRRQLMKQMSYCPQENILFDLLTTQEHLDLFATLHGIPSGQRRLVVRNLSDEVGLGLHSNKYSSELSGGTCILIAGF